MSRWKTALAVSAVLFASSAQAHQKSLPIGPCINLGNTLEVGKQRTLGDGAVSAQDFKRIRAAGFETVRIPARWDDRSQSTAPYTVDPAWMDQVQRTVDWAIAADLKVILNSHHFNPIYDDPIAVQPWHTAVWKQIGNRFKDYPTDRLWFELENEPHKNFTNANLNAVLEPALAVVREGNPTRPVIIGGENWSGIDSLAVLNLPDDPYVIPTFHYYTPFDFTHQGASWVAPDIPKPGRVYGSDADRALLAADVAKIEAYKKRTGLTPFMGETGAYDLHIPLAQRVQYHNAIRAAFEPAGVAMCTWAYANTFPFYDRKTGQWLPGMRGALGLKED